MTLSSDNEQEPEKAPDLPELVDGDQAASGCLVFELGQARTPNT